MALDALGLRGPTPPPRAPGLGVDVTGPVPPGGPMRPAAIERVPAEGGPGPPERASAERDHDRMPRRSVPPGVPSGKEDAVERPP